MNMYKQCKNKNAQRRQIEIALSLMHLMEKQQLQHITVKDICDNINVPRRAFYRYFETKNDCLTAMLDYIILSYESYPKKYNTLQERTLELDMETFFDFYYQNQIYLKIIFNNDLFSLLLQRYVYWTKNANQVYDLDYLLGEENNREKHYSLLFCMSGLVFSLFNWYYDGCQPSPKEMAKIISKNLINGLNIDPQKLKKENQ